MAPKRSRMAARAACWAVAAILPLFGLARGLTAEPPRPADPGSAAPSPGAAPAAGAEVGAGAGAEVGADALRIGWRDACHKVRPGEDPADGAAAGSLPIRLAAARGEYEPVQILLRSERAVTIRVLPGLDLTGPEGVRLPDSALESVRQVGFVTVRHSTDKAGAVGEIADPLLPLLPPDAAPGAPSASSGLAEAAAAAAAGPTGRLTLEPGRTAALWLTFRIPPAAVPGDYLGRLRLAPDAGPSLELPIALRVWDFTLPAETHTRTAYGVALDLDWHGPLDADAQRRTYDLYLADFARHRVSPYDPFRYTPPRETPDGLDWTEFDRQAERAFGEWGFTGFNLPLPTDLPGLESFAPQYRERAAAWLRPRIAHLAERGWLGRAYSYWVDEPGFHRYAWARAGMLFLKAEAPGLRRLLTFNHGYSPQPYFHGAVDLWVAIFHGYDPAAARARQAQGEEVWWYVCTSPKAPYPNNFIDHAGIEQRIRFWLMERFGVDGDLYWSTTYWQYKDPWADPMSYAEPTRRRTWGNGDGYLLYPPTRARPTGPVVAGPIDTVRWELIREGLEDREYFWLLRQRLAAAPSAGARAAGEAALGAALGLARGLTDYERDPARLAAARAALAQAIEALGGTGAGRGRGRDAGGADAVSGGSPSLGRAPLQRRGRERAPGLPRPAGHHFPSFRTTVASSCHSRPSASATTLRVVRSCGVPAPSTIVA